MSNIDPIDKMLQGDDPSQASQPNGDQQTAPAQPADQRTEEEVEFNKLSGSAQERFRETINEKNRLARELEEARQARQNLIPPAPNSLLPEQEQAVNTLKKMTNFTTKDEVKEEVSQGLNQIRWDLKNQSLETRFTGEDGKPKYDRTEVEDYMKTHPQYAYYDPEDVFKMKMYPDEFYSGNQQPQRKGTPSLRPNKSAQRQDALTPEYIEERLKQPDADQWYEDHKDEINKVVYNHTQQFKGTNFGGQ